MLEESKDDDKLSKVLQLSRGTAIVLLCLYLVYMVFQLHTHRNLFDTAVADEDSEGENTETSDLSAVAALVVLVLTTLIIAYCAEALVESIDGIVESSHMSKNFIGLILVPIVSNAAEHATACVVAIKNKMDLVRAWKTPQEDRVM